jgi:uncharacterized UBP type Zn finger protein
MNKKQQLLTSLIAKIKQPKTSAEELINGLSELETETKKDCSHCQHQKYAQQISVIKAGKWEQKNPN